MIPRKLWAGKTPSNTEYVVVTWRDIHYEADWEEEGIKGPKRRMVQKGYLLYQGSDPEESDQIITVIANTWDDEDKLWADFTTFPGTVIKTIEPDKKRRRKRGKDNNRGVGDAGSNNANPAGVEGLTKC